MHGHQLRRVAEMINIESWGDVKVGALYGAIHRLEAESLIEPIRSEQEGRFPVRTVYAITEEGRQELAILRSRSLQEARLANDPFDVAMTFVDAGLDEVEMLLGQRRGALTGQLDALVSERGRLGAPRGPAPLGYPAIPPRGGPPGGGVGELGGDGPPRP